MGIGYYCPCKKVLHFKDYVTEEQAVRAWNKKQRELERRADNEQSK